MPLDCIVDLAIRKAPIEIREELYCNIVFSGGSTKFSNFDKWLELELRWRVRQRY